MKNKEIYKYTWKEMMTDCKSLSEDIIKADLNIKNIYGNPRGGLVPAVILSHLLNIPMIFRRDRIIERTLVVDDISDSGKTLKDLMRESEAIYSLTLWQNKHTIFIPTFSKNTYSNRWIHFPFETSKSTGFKD